MRVCLRSCGWEEVYLVTRSRLETGDWRLDISDLSWLHFITLKHLGQSAVVPAVCCLGRKPTNFTATGKFSLTI